MELKENDRRANPPRDARAALDTAVLTAYGFSAKKDLLAQLLALNLERAAEEAEAAKVEKPKTAGVKRTEQTT